MHGARFVFANLHFQYWLAKLDTVAGRFALATLYTGKDCGIFRMKIIKPHLSFNVLDRTPQVILRLLCQAALLRAFHSGG